MKTTMKNTVGLALLTTLEMILWIVCLASDPVKFFSQPPVLESRQSSPLLIIKSQYQRTMNFITLPFIFKNKQTNKKTAAGAEL